MGGERQKGNNTNFLFDRTAAFTAGRAWVPESYLNYVTNVVDTTRGEDHCSEGH